MRSWIVSVSSGISHTKGHCCEVGLRGIRGILYLPTFVNASNKRGETLDENGSLRFGVSRLVVGRGVSWFLAGAPCCGKPDREICYCGGSRAARVCLC